MLTIANYHSLHRSLIFWTFGLHLLSNSGDSTASFSTKLKTGIKNSLNPPIIATLLGLFVGLIPGLQSLFFGSDPALRSLSNAIETFGQPSVGVMALIASTSVGKTIDLHDILLAAARMWARVYERCVTILHGGVLGCWQRCSNSSDHEIQLVNNENSNGNIGADVDDDDDELIDVDLVSFLRPLCHHNAQHGNAAVFAESSLSDSRERDNNITRTPGSANRRDDNNNIVCNNITIDSDRWSATSRTSRNERTEENIGLSIPDSFSTFTISTTAPAVSQPNRASGITAAATAAPVAIVPLSAESFKATKRDLAMLVFGRMVIIATIQFAIAAALGPLVFVGADAKLQVMVTLAQCITPTANTIVAVSMREGRVNQAETISRAMVFQFLLAVVSFTIFLAVALALFF